MDNDPSPVKFSPVYGCTGLGARPLNLSKTPERCKSPAGNWSYLTLSTLARVCFRWAPEGSVCFLGRRPPVPVAQLYALYLLHFIQGHFSYLRRPSEGLHPSSVLYPNQKKMDFRAHFTGIL